MRFRMTEKDNMRKTDIERQIVRESNTKRNKSIGERETKRDSNRKNMKGERETDRQTD